MSLSHQKYPQTGRDSTLFNALTGARQHVGNWPGKTVEKKEGSFKYKEKKYTLLDLRQKVYACYLLIIHDFYKFIFNLHRKKWM